MKNEGALIVNYQPNCGEQTITQLSDDLVLSIFEHITKMDRVEASWSVVLSPLTRIASLRTSAILWAKWNTFGGCCWR